MNKVLEVISQVEMGGIDDEEAIDRIISLRSDDSIIDAVRSLLDEKKFFELQLLVRVMTENPSPRYREILDVLLRVRDDELPLDDVIDCVIDCKDPRYIEALREIVNEAIPGDDFHQINKKAFLALRSLGLQAEQLSEVAKESGFDEVIELQRMLD